MSAFPLVTIVDYGMGNLGSVTNAFRYLGCSAQVSSDPDIVATSECLLLPGVGSFHRAMNSLKKRGLSDAIIEAVRGRGTRILGICLGMQLLGKRGFEDGETQGLGLIDADVVRFSQEEIEGKKVPHVGFDEVEISSGSVLMADLKDRADFYFVHSYRMLPEGLRGNISCCNYGVSFVAAIEDGNINATQFHPEKSQCNGLRLLRNYISA